ncbi:unnamed protein product, partial [Timema podura]|nr:unnamed protein product [Timema podura]
ATTWKAFPEVIFGLLTLSGGLLGLLLPETFNKKLPDTVQEGENYGKDLEKRQKSNRRSRTSDTNQDLPLG